MIFSDILKTYRKHLNYTQIDLSKITKIDLNTIKTYETNRAVASIENLISFSSLFKLSLDYLIMDSDSKYMNDIIFVQMANTIDSKIKEKKLDIISVCQNLLIKYKYKNKSQFDRNNLNLGDSFSTNLKILRKEKKISQITLSKATGLSQRAISSYETGESLPIPKNFKKLSQFFSISIHHLITGRKLFWDFKDKDFEDIVLTADKILDIEDKFTVNRIMKAIIDNN